MLTAGNCSLLMFVDSGYGSHVDASICFLNWIVAGLEAFAVRVNIAVFTITAHSSRKFARNSSCHAANDLVSTSASVVLG